MDQKRSGRRDGQKVALVAHGDRVEVIDGGNLGDWSLTFVRSGLSGRGRSFARLAHKSIGSFSDADTGGQEAIATKLRLPNPATSRQNVKC